MGKYKFRFSDMIPNILKDTSRSKPRSKIINPTNKHHSLPNSQINSHHRNSYYFSRDHQQKPPHQFASDSRESAPDHSSSTESNPCNKCGGKIIDTTAGDDHCRRLKPIITKKDEVRTPALSIKVVKEDIARRVPAKSPGVRLRVNSPRIANRRIQGRKRRSISDSFAVVKASRDPRRDFRESMVEMITENNIKASKDLEELLACYLSLNSDEYHHLIINVFKQIWFDFMHLRLN